MVCGTSRSPPQSCELCLLDILHAVAIAVVMQRWLDFQGAARVPSWGI